MKRIFSSFCAAWTVVVLELACVAPAAAFPQYEITNPAVVAAQYPAWIAWDHDGRRLAYYVERTTAAGPGSDLWTYDLASGENRLLLSAERRSSPVDQFGLPRAVFTPDGTALLYNSSALQPEHRMVVSRKPIANGDVSVGIEQGVVTPNDIVPGTVGGSVSVLEIFVPRTGELATQFLLMLTGAVDPNDDGIYAMEMDFFGRPTSPARQLASGLMADARLSPDGDRLVTVAEQAGIPTVWMISDVAAILRGETPVVDNLSDPRVRPVSGTNIPSVLPVWSQDGSLVYLTEDRNRLFTWDVLSTFPLAHFDIAVIRTVDVLTGGIAPTSLPSDQSRFIQVAAPGGTRFAFRSDKVSPGLTVAQLTTTDELELDENGFVAVAFELVDGSGSSLRIAAGTVVSGVDAGEAPDAPPSTLPISVFTPISVVAESLLPRGRGLTAFRDFGPDGLNFDPPATLTLSYTDGEVRDLIEQELEVVGFNSATQQYDLALAVIDRDFDANRLTVSLPHFSGYGVQAPLAPARCALHPRSDCIAAGKALVHLDERKVGSEKLKLGWKDFFALGDYGDPVFSSTSFASCIYDDSGSLVGEWDVARAGDLCGSKPCWAAGGGGYRYHDGAGDAHGVTKVAMAQGDGKIGVQGRNDSRKGMASLPLGVAASLQGQETPTVQFVVRDGRCFSTRLDRVMRSDSTFFKGVARSSSDE